MIKDSDSDMARRAAWRTLTDASCKLRPLNTLESFSKFPVFVPRAYAGIVWFAIARFPLPRKSVARQLVKRVDTCCSTHAQDVSTVWCVQRFAEVMLSVC